MFLVQVLDRCTIDERPNIQMINFSMVTSIDIAVADNGEWGGYGICFSIKDSSTVIIEGFANANEANIYFRRILDRYDKFKQDGYWRVFDCNVE